MIHQKPDLPILVLAEVGSVQHRVQEHGLH